jgi:amylovoran biosynthesis glycosyltransferase AmsB
MKFSVLIPCYNASSTITQTLESIKQQTFSDFEVIVIDDASEDQTALLKLLEHYRTELNLSVLTNEANKNGAYSRNRGIRAAKGEYIAFLDADDSWVPTRLEQAMKAIQRLPANQFVLYGKFELIRNRPTGALLPIRGIRHGEQVAEYVFAAGQHMQTSTFVCPAEVARSVMFDESLTRHQDSDFMMRAQAQGVDLVFQNIKCASYHFRATDMRKRVQAGRINSAFCIHWLIVKKPYFSAAATAGYVLSTFARIVYMEGQTGKSLRMAASAVTNIGWRNLVDLTLTKILIIFKTRLGF